MEQDQERLGMSNNVTIVTSPDDFLADGFRFMVVDLTETQTKIISDVLLELKFVGNIIVYFYKSTDPIEWFLDKKSKSDFIIFNAESNNELLIGYLAAQKNSHYFGILKTLSGANKSAIYSVEDIISLLTFRMENNG